MYCKNIKDVPTKYPWTNSVPIKIVIVLLVAQNLPHLLSASTTTSTTITTTTTGAQPQGTTKTSATSLTASSSTAATSTTTVKSTTFTSNPSTERKSTTTPNKHNTTINSIITPTSTLPALNSDNNSTSQQSVNALTTSPLITNYTDDINPSLDRQTSSGVLLGSFSSLTTEKSSSITSSMLTTSVFDRTTLIPVTSGTPGISTSKLVSLSTASDTGTNTATMPHSIENETTQPVLHSSSNAVTPMSSYMTPSFDTGSSTGYRIPTSGEGHTETVSLSSEGTPVVLETSSSVPFSASVHTDTEVTTKVPSSSVVPTSTATSRLPPSSNAYVSSPSSSTSGNPEDGMSSIMSTTRGMTSSSTTNPLLGQINDLQNKNKELEKIQSQYVIAVVVLVIVIVLFIVGVAVFFYRRRLIRRRKQDEIFHDPDLSTEEVKTRRNHYMETEIALGSRLDGRYSVASIGDSDGDGNQFNTFTRNNTRSSVNGAPKLPTVVDENEDTEDSSYDNGAKTSNVEVDIDNLPPPPGPQSVMKEIERESEAENSTSKETSELLNTTNSET